VSSGNESGRIMYRTVEPRTVIESRVTVSRFLAVYLTARSATFMRGETEVMVPLTIVPFGSQVWFIFRESPVESCMLAHDAGCMVYSLELDCQANEEIADNQVTL
jgi:hypothetical protein